VKKKETKTAKKTILKTPKINKKGVSIRFSCPQVADTNNLMIQSQLVND